MFDRLPGQKSVLLQTVFAMTGLLETRLQMRTHFSARMTVTANARAPRWNPPPQRTGFGRLVRQQLGLAPSAAVRCGLALPGIWWLRAKKPSS
jgi:hypothetical protein